jgi:hypothetical protein
MTMLPAITFFIAWALLGVFIYCKREHISKLTGLSLYGSIEAAGMIGGFLVFVLGAILK